MRKTIISGSTEEAEILASKGTNLSSFHELGIKRSRFIVGKNYKVSSKAGTAIIAALSIQYARREGNTRSLIAQDASKVLAFCCKREFAETPQTIPTVAG